MTVEHAADARSIEPLTAPPDAAVRPPGSKSITNRALILAAFADAPSTILGALDADDVDAMIDALRSLGTRIERTGDRLRIEPANSPGDIGPLTVDARLSGTTSRFVLPAAALAGVPVTVDGAGPLRRRPMGPLLDALVALGVRVTCTGAPGCLPVRVDGGGVAGGHVSVDGSSSSQFLSALLLSASRFPDGLHIVLTGTPVALPFVELTVSIMQAFGLDVDTSSPGAFAVPQGVANGRSFAVEPDATAASYFFAAAAITGGRVRVDGLGASSLQGDLAFLDVLEQMGATIHRSEEWTEVVGSALRGVDVDLSAIPDTALTLAAVAVFADGPTRVRGVDFIRGHETDRVAAVVTELRRMGLDAEETDDGFVIRPGDPRPTLVRTYDDHRMAMSAALIGLRATGIRIADPGVTAKTYPGFWRDLERLRRSSGADDGR